MADLIDFGALNDALLKNSDALVSRWLPGGKRIRHEYVCGSLGGGAGRSCSVNLNSGKWGDFQSGEGGKDLCGLYAAIHGMSQKDAALELMRDEGLSRVPVQASALPVAKSKQRASDEGWRTQRPVPVGAPQVNFRHIHRQSEDITHTAEYRVGGDLHGYVVRFATSDGGKETLPRTWCISARDGASKWHWRQYDDPRPLYLPTHRLPEGRTVIVVEGERKADVLQRLLDAVAPGVYCVASWPGGCKAWQKSDWTWLAGSSVVLWPDCDAKHENLTPAERKATPDKLAQLVLQQSKPLLDAAEQGGMKAMLGIGMLLRDVHGCKVQLLPIPAPGEVVDGWDCANAIEDDGWDFDRVVAFFSRAVTLLTVVPASKPVVAAGSSSDEPPEKKRVQPADADSDGDAFQEHIDFVCAQLKCKPWDLGVNRKLIISSLSKAPALSECLGFNELVNAPGTVRPWPWRGEAGPLAETDDLRLGDWLSREYKLKAASRAALTEAIDTVADMRRFHPIRGWLKEIAWDGKPRLEKWLMYVLGIDPEVLSTQRERYFSLVGKYMLMGLVARVMEPGVKFDYSPVFEGKGGIGKSTFAKELVGAQYFSDTHFDIGNGKEGMEQLEGLWGYELSEMTAFKRADSEQVKQFFSSTIDRFRGAYGKYVQPHKRQCVIFCTTNKRQYLYDLTGNRRFWPIWIENRIKIEWLRKWRAQLFAEAYAAWLSGERFFPTPEEEDAYFVPEQELRLVETTVQSKLYEMLTRDGAPATEGRASNDFNVHTKFITLHGLVQALGTDAAKSTSLLESQIRGWLEASGWQYGRESTGQRRRGYMPPPVWPPVFAEEEVVEEKPELPAHAGGSVEEGDDAPF